MRRIYLEDGYDPPQNRWFAHSADHPGLFVKAPTREEALERFPAAARAYALWLQRHGEPPVDVSGEVAVEDVPWDQAVPPTPDRARLRRLLQYAQADYLALVQDIAGEQWDWAEYEGGWSIRTILPHVTSAEYYYWEAQDDSSLRGRLGRVRRSTLERLGTAPADRTGSAGGMVMNLAKVLRRTLEHEREHTEQLRRYRAALGLENPTEDEPAYASGGRTTYRISLVENYDHQSGKPKWMAHVHGLPGCYTKGTSRAEVLAAVPAAAASYAAWLRRHGEAAPPPPAEAAVEVAEVIDRKVGSPLFQPDLAPPERGRLHRLLEYARLDLLALLDDLKTEHLWVRPMGGGWFTANIFSHVARSELIYWGTLDPAYYLDDQRAVRELTEGRIAAPGPAPPRPTPWNTTYSFGKAVWRVLEHQIEHILQLRRILRAHGR